MKKYARCNIKNIAVRIPQEYMDDHIKIDNIEETDVLPNDCIRLDLIGCKAWCSECCGECLR